MVEKGRAMSLRHHLECCALCWRLLFWNWTSSVLTSSCLLRMIIFGHVIIELFEYYPFGCTRKPLITIRNLAQEIMNLLNLFLAHFVDRFKRRLNFLGTVPVSFGSKLADFINCSVQLLQILWRSCCLIRFIRFTAQQYCLLAGPQTFSGTNIWPLITHPRIRLSFCRRWSYRWIYLNWFFVYDIRHYICYLW